MKEYTIEQYKRMSDKFNKLSFSEKIKAIKESKLLTLESDHNWFGVSVIDLNMKKILEDEGIVFNIENEWDSSEIHDLIFMLNIPHRGM